MERRAEINRFAIFLFCLLVPLGSLAPTETSENRITTGQRQKLFTTKIPVLAAMIGKQAHELFEFYVRCVSATLHSRHETFRSRAKDMADRILECPAFHANCCALHHIYNILEALEIEIESICTDTSRNITMDNLNQLNTTLSERKAFYTCRTNNQVYPQLQTMSLPEKKTYIWWVLKKYEKIMQITNNLYAEAEV